MKNRSQKENRMGSSELLLFFLLVLQANSCHFFLNIIKELCRYWKIRPFQKIKDWKHNVWTLDEVIVLSFQNRLHGNKHIQRDSPAGKRLAWRARMLALQAWGRWWSPSPLVKSKLLCTPVSLALGAETGRFPRLPTQTSHGRGRRVREATW